MKAHPLYMDLWLQPSQDFCQQHEISLGTLEDIENYLSRMLMPDELVFTPISEKHFNASNPEKVESLVNPDGCTLVYLEMDDWPLMALKTPTGEHYLLSSVEGHVLMLKYALLLGKPISRNAERYNPEYGDEKICQCGHPYHRHFDSYEDMDPIGCKYCQCETFKPQQPDQDVWDRKV